jgi:NAD(P)-dependent dehydrogenase (short-subunit alcohol dehydrogenase family)
VRLALITGASRGLGAAVADHYRAHGWEVIGFSRTAGKRVDLSDPAGADRSFAETLGSLASQQWEELLAVGNAAVLGPVGPLTAASAEEIEAHLDVNVVSAVLFARAYIGAFQEHACPKTFVNVSSGAAVKAYAGWSLYCTSKAAMEAHVRVLAAEQAMRQHPIRALSVNPGVMDTAMQAEVRASSLSDFPEHERFMRLQADGRLAEPAKVAERIAELVAARPEAGGVYSVALS